MKFLARLLRRDATDAERVLWHHLRARRMEVFKFRRQFVIEPYIVDFVCLEAKLIIEADGGHHNDQRVEDVARTRSLEMRGFRVLRFWNNEILKETRSVLECIHQELLNLPHPNPSPGGRGA